MIPQNKKEHHKLEKQEHKKGIKAKEWHRIRPEKLFKMVSRDRAQKTMLLMQQVSTNLMES